MSRVSLLTQFVFNSTTEVLNYILENANSPLYVQTLALATGWNAIVPPSKAGGVVIWPQPEATAAATLKGVTGDTGIALAVLAPTMLSFGDSPPNFGLTWAGTEWAEEAVTADSATDKITLAAHLLTDGDRVLITATSLPGGLVEGTWYYVINSTANDFKLATTANGSAIDITSNGTAVKLTSANTVKLVWI